MPNQTAQFNGEVGNIESNVNKVDTFSEDISEEAAKQKYPSVKCLKDIPRIIESGTSGIWTYRKWSDGIYEAWYQDENTAAYSFPNKYGATVGSDRIMYTTDSIDHDLPTFSNSITFYTGTASAISLFSWGLIWMEDVNGSSKIRVRVATNTNLGTDTSSCRINLYIKGTWK